MYIDVNLSIRSIYHLVLMMYLICLRFNLGSQNVDFDDISTVNGTNLSKEPHCKKCQP